MNSIDVRAKPHREALIPERCVLIVFDLLEFYKEVAADTGVIGPVSELVTRCRERGVAIVWARADHRPDGLDFALTLADVDSRHRPFDVENPRPTGPGPAASDGSYASIAELGQAEEDYDLPKHRWSAFAGTHLDISMRSAGRETVLIVGGSTHVGIASTIYAARDLDYQAVVVSDGLTGRQPQRDFFIEQIFPRVCRVRTIQQVNDMLDAGAAENAHPSAKRGVTDHNVSN